jgi:hypothetical protein
MATAQQQLPAGSPGSLPLPPVLAVTSAPVVSVPAATPVSMPAMMATPPALIPVGSTLVSLPPTLPATQARLAAYASTVQPEVQLASFYNRAMQSPEQSGGGEFPRSPYWGSPNIVVPDPFEYERPRSVDVDDPNRFWYTFRPNIFNVPVEPEWDFYALINTDRPDFTDAVYTVGKGVTYLETGYTFHKINDDIAHVSTRQLPESLLRYGITNNFELRAKWFGYLMTETRDVATGLSNSQFGGQDLDVGFKWNFIKQRGWRPMTTLVAGAIVPTGTRGVSANQTQPHFNLLVGWNLRRWLYLKSQFGCDFVRVKGEQISTESGVPVFVAVADNVNSWHESVSVLTQWTKRIGAFHEWYMISNQTTGDTRAQHFLDTGLFVYATPNVQFDVRVGKRLSDRVDDFFAGAGASTRW